MRYSAVLKLGCWVDFLLFLWFEYLSMYMYVHIVYSLLKIESTGLIQIISILSQLRKYVSILSNPWYHWYSRLFQNVLNCQKQGKHALKQVKSTHFLPISFLSNSNSLVSKQKLGISLRICFFLFLDGEQFLDYVYDKTGYSLPFFFSSLLKKGKE